MPRRPTAGFPDSAFDSFPKIRGWPDASQILAPPFAEVLKRLFSSRLQFTVSNIRFELFVPLLGVALGKPLAQYAKLLGR
jgi:hypothetical protein